MKLLIVLLLIMLKYHLSSIYSVCLQIVLTNNLINLYNMNSVFHHPSYLHYAKIKTIASKVSKFYAVKTGCFYEHNIYLLDALTPVC